MDIKTSSRMAGMVSQAQFELVRARPHVCRQHHLILK